jgi:hypothetical protein
LGWGVWIGWSSRSVNSRRSVRSLRSLRKNCAVFVVTDRDAIEEASDFCAVADGTDDQHETHATVPDMVVRQWLRLLCWL